MQAVVYKEYGPPSVLHLTEIEKPIPKKHEVLVKIKTSTVSAGVVWLRKGAFPSSWFYTLIIRLFFGVVKPRRTVIGFEFSGIVEDCGNEVSKFRKGDHVYGTTRGLKNGAYAEYICVPEKRKSGVISLVPKGFSFEAAAALPIGGMTAFQLLKKAGIQKNMHVMIYGASGSVGTYAVQIAKYYGCFVTAACSTANFDLVKSIGADRVIDYKKLIGESFKNEFDIVFDAVGKLSTSIARLMRRNGGAIASVKELTNEKIEYLDCLHEIISKGKLEPVIDRVYSIEEIVKAHTYVEQGHKKGNVVITLAKSVQTKTSFLKFYYS